MDLAVGIERRNGDLMAAFLEESSGIALRPLTDLADRGLPARMKARTQLSTDFRSWRPASFNEFAFAMGAKVEVPEQHVTWCFIHDGRRYVVPALVLMRALFRPTARMLEFLYRPQSLEDVCTFAKQPDGCHVAAIQSLGDRVSRIRPYLLFPLSWYFCLPSARAAWSSVLRFGNEGRLGLELPKATAQLVLTGQAQAQNVYVTALHVKEVSALEAPLESASTHPRSIPFHARALVSPSEDARRSKQVVALRAGVASVSEEEWAEIGPLLDTGFGGTLARGNLRATLDGVLQRLCFGTPWKETDYPDGLTYAAAATALYRWRLDGRWAKVESVLSHHRGEPSGSV
jgi:hypothetical protein